jgi:hypothetical protein
MNWLLDVAIAAILLYAIFRQHDDLVDTRRQLDALGADHKDLRREMRALRKLRSALPEERRAAIHWPHPKETP